MYLASLAIEVDTTDLERADKLMGNVGDSSEQVGQRTQKSFNSANSSIDKTATRTAGLSSSMGALKGVIAGLGIVTLGKQAVQMETEFQRSLSSVQGKLKLTAEGMVDLRDVAKDLGATTAFSASEAAQGMDFLAAAGLSATEIMEALPATLELASAGALSLSESADIATNIMGAYGATVEDLPRINDIMASGAANANASVSEMYASFQKVGPAAKAVGVSIEETAATIGLLADAGVKTEIAGTQMKAAMTSLLNPTGKTKESFIELGIKQSDLFDIAADGSKKIKPLGDVIEILGDKGIDAQNAFEIFSVTSASVFSLLLGKGKDAFNGYVEGVGESGAAARMAETNMQGLPGAFALLASAWEALNLAIVGGGGSDFIEKIIRGIAAALGYLSTDGIQAIKNISSAFGNFMETSGLLQGMSDGIKLLKNTFTETATAVKGVFDAIKPAEGTALAEMFETILENIRPAIPYLTAIVAGFISIGGTLAVLAPIVGAITGIIAVITALGAAALFNPVTLGIAAIAGAAILITKNWDGIVQWWEDMWAKIGVEPMAVYNWLRDVFFAYSPLGIIIKNYGAILEFFEGFWQDVKDTFTVFFSDIADIFKDKTIIDGFRRNWDDILIALGKFALNMLASLGDLLLDIISWAIDVGVKLLNEVGKWTAGILKAIGGWITTIPAKLAEVGSAFIDWIIDLAIEISRRAYDMGGQVVDSVVDGVAGLPAAMVSKGKDGIQGLINGAKSLFGVARDVGAEAGNEIVAGAASQKGLHTQSPSKRMHQLGVWAGQGLANGLNETQEDIKQVALGVSDTIIDNIFDGESVKDIFDDVGTWMDDWLSQKAKDFLQNQLMINLGVDTDGAEGTLTSLANKFLGGGGDNASLANAFGISDIATGTGVMNSAGQAIEVGDNYIAPATGAAATGAAMPPAAAAAAAYEFTKILAPLATDGVGQLGGNSELAQKLEWSGIGPQLIAGAFGGNKELVDQGVNVSGTLGDLNTQSFDYSEKQLSFYRGTRSYEEETDVDTTGISEIVQTTIAGIGTSTITAFAELGESVGTAVKTIPVTARPSVNNFEESMAIMISETTEGAIRAGITASGPETKAMFGHYISDIGTASEAELSEAMSRISGAVTVVGPAFEALGINISTANKATNKYNEGLLMIVDAYGSAESAQQGMIAMMNGLAGESAALDFNIGLLEGNLVEFNTAVGLTGTQAVASRSGLLDYIKEQQAIVALGGPMAKQAAQNIAAATAQIDTMGALEDAQIAQASITTTVTGALYLAGVEFNTLGTDATTLAGQISDAAGGITAFSELTTNFYDITTSNAQKTADIMTAASSDVNNFNLELIKSGGSAITSLDGLALYQEGLNLSTEAGLEAYVASLKVADAFNTVEAAAKISQQNVQALSTILNDAGIAFDGLSPSAHNTSDAILAVWGTMDAFAAAQASVMDKFYTEQERLEMSMTSSIASVAAFNESIGKTGSDAIDTVPEYRAFLDEIRQTEGVGSAAYQQALLIGDAMFDITESGKSLEENIATIPESLRGTYETTLANTVVANDSMIAEANDHLTELAEINTAKFTAEREAAKAINLDRLSFQIQHDDSLTELQKLTNIDRLVKAQAFSDELVTIDDSYTRARLATMRATSDLDIVNREANLQLIEAENIRAQAEELDLTKAANQDIHAEMIELAGNLTTEALDMKVDTSQQTAELAKNVSANISSMTISASGDTEVLSKDVIDYISSMAISGSGDTSELVKNVTEYIKSMSLDTSIDTQQMAHNIKGYVNTMASDAAREVEQLRDSVTGSFRSINNNVGGMVDGLAGKANTAANNTGSGNPSGYYNGEDYFRNEQVIKVHRGEAVLTAEQNLRYQQFKDAGRYSGDEAANNASRGTSSSNDTLANELAEMRKENNMLLGEQNAILSNIASSNNSTATDIKSVKDGTSRLNRRLGEGVNG